LLARADARWGLALLVVTIILVYISIFRLAFTWDLVVAQGRYLFTALPAMAILVALGLAAWFPPRLQPGAMFGLAAGMFALAAYALFGVLSPAFSPPPRLSADALSAIQHPADVRYGPSIRLLGYDLERARLAPGETVRLMTYWQADQSLEDGYMQFAQVLDGEGRVVGQVDRIPLDGRYPTVSWLPHRPFRELVEIPFADWAAPGQASVIVGWYPRGRPEARLAATEDGQPVPPYGDAFTIPIEIAAESAP